MTYTANNPLLYNAAIAGIAAGAVAASNPGGAAQGVGAATAIAAANAANLAAAVTIAQAVDQLIGSDAAITSAGPVTIEPTTAAITNAEISKAGAMYAVAYSEAKGQADVASLVGSPSPVAGAVAGMAASIAAKYGSIITAPFSLL